MVNVTWCRNEQWIVEIIDEDGQTLSKFAADTNQTREQVIQEAITSGLDLLYSEVRGGDDVGKIPRQSEGDRGSQPAIP